MAYRKVTRVEIQEIIRRWQSGRRVPPNCLGDRCIAEHGAQVPLPAQGQVLSAAKAEGIARDGPAPTADQLSRQAETPSEDLLAPWADQIY